MTGAGSGIGREVALRLLRRGASVAAVDVRTEPLVELARVAGDSGSQVSQHVVDITNRSAVDALVQEVVRIHGSVTGVVNVAGIIHRFVPLSELTFEEIDRVMAVNFFGTLNMVKSFLPELTSRPRAYILNVASMGGLVPSPGQGAYGASKAAVKMLTDALFVELADTNIRVRLVIPGSVATDIAGNPGIDVAALIARAPRNTPPQRITGAEEAGRQIVEALSGDEYRTMIGVDAHNIDKESRLAPTRVLETVSARAREMNS